MYSYCIKRKEDEKGEKIKLQLVVPILYPKLEQNCHVLNKIKRLQRLI